jgi:UPF0755 protein
MDENEGKSRKTASVQGLLGILALGACLLGYLAWIYWFFPYGSSPFPKSVEIPLGRSLKDVARILETEGIILDSRAFSILSHLRKCPKNLKAGIYKFQEPLSAWRVLDLLDKGRPELVRITIPEGCTLANVAERLSASGLVAKESFMKTARDSLLISELLGFRAPSLEGFLFPDTYLFPPGVGDRTIISTMVGRFHEIFDPTMRKRAQEMGLSILEVVTLASLVEKETAIAEERPIVAAVFHKRLRMGMRLESDPSVIYGMESFDGKLTRKDLLSPHPYNTYLHWGLPPGPICSPGKEALRAVLFPADCDFLYFVSRNDGTHHFSRNLKEHMEAVSQYRRSRK